VRQKVKKAQGTNKEKVQICKTSKYAILKDEVIASTRQKTQTNHE
jgi:hypothetical protein